MGNEFIQTSNRILLPRKTGPCGKIIKINLLPYLNDPITTETSNRRITERHPEIGTATHTAWFERRFAFRYGLRRVLIHGRS